MTGVKKLSLYTDDAVYAVECQKRTNLFKYMVCGYRLKQAAAPENGEEYYGY